MGRAGFLQTGKRRKNITVPAYHRLNRIEIHEQWIEIGIQYLTNKEVKWFPIELRGTSFMWTAGVVEPTFSGSSKVIPETGVA